MTSSWQAGDRLHSTKFIRVISAP